MDISKELQEILEQLGVMQQPKQETQVQAQTQAQTEPQAQTQPVEQTQPKQTTTETYNLDEVKKQVEEWIAVGRQIFISRYAGYPVIVDKLLPVIEQRARLKLRMDLEKGVDPKPNFFYYLEEAKEEIQRELLETAQSFNTMNPQTVIAQYPQPQVKKEPIYSLEDFYNDYKKMLEDITDENTTILFQDGKRLENGKLTRFGEGKKKLGQRPTITVE